MIKDFNDFVTNRELLDNERESMERELRTRKSMRNNKKYDLQINLDLIKDHIIHAIENQEDYTLSIGSKFEKIEGVSDSKIFHIEFENEDLGRVRIFKPKDNEKTYGYYEINGDVYKTSVKEVRNFYHI